MSRQVAVVTGARGVVGRAVIARLIDDGYAVVTHSREAVVDLPEGVVSLTGDLAHPEAAERVRESVERVDLLVNNAASQVTGALDELTESDWAEMLGATFLSAVQLTMALRPVMAEGASVVNVSSIEAQAAFPRHAHYAAAKAALESFTRSSALEWAPAGVRVNAVAPGLVDRPGLADDWPEGWSWWQRSCPLGRPILPAEVADAVVFLAGASGVSGVVLPVDGGWSASARLG
jgi:NAD(P)-dependent dehydrogenase (short-subunit alcohol dehydrogenase family)